MQPENQLTVRNFLVEEKERVIGLQHASGRQDADMSAKTSAEPYISCCFTSKHKENQSQSTSENPQ